MTLKSTCKSAFLIAIMLLNALASYAQIDNLLPRPKVVNTNKGELKINKIKVSAEVKLQAAESFVSSHDGIVTDKAKSTLSIRIVDDMPEAKLNKNEAYRLRVETSGINIEATCETGVLRALQTLDQLSEKGKNGYVVKCVDIVDWPAFRVRGFMMDAGRTYIPVSELKREIETLARFKVNVFHWHFTENQAWRLESKIYPQLNAAQNMTRQPGLYYTHDDVREIDAFCKEHGMMLLPEIDMPGHSEAFERTFGFSMQSEEGTQVVKDLIAEACKVFKGEWLHIGTDEVGFTNPDFVPEMVKFVRSKGKKVMSWNPGWKYKKGEIDGHMLWSYAGKAQKGIPAIDCRFHYINHFDTFADVVALYRSKIYDAEEGSDDIAGTIIAVWNDRFIEDPQQIVVQNNLYPSALAMAERAWMGGGSEYFNKKGVMLDPEDKEDFEAFVDFERRLLWHKNNSLKGLPIAYIKQTDMQWKISDAFPNGGNLDASFPPEQGIKDSYNYEGNTYGWRSATGAGIYLRHVWGSLIPAFYKNPQENHTAYAYSDVFSPRKQKATMIVEFQNYSRSEKDLPPHQGCWDYKGSRIWLNGKEIMPPVWTATHTEKDNEIELGNENFAAREPITVELEEGMNRIFIKLPVGKFNIPEVRLNKWMFTCAVVLPEEE